MIETSSAVFGGAPKTAEEAPAPPGDRHILPLTWLNLVCLDAPLVAVSWAWVFGRSFSISVTPGAACALFLTGWVIYLADRFGDSLSTDPAAATSLRQRFCLRHSAAWIGAIALAAAADLFVICTRLVSASQLASLLTAVQLFRDNIEPDSRTALADLVLLTPLAVLLVAARSS